ncbi:MAG: ABC transporter permease [Synergistaceae bacterium]|nr:ABC transporter permease [Synergistaceae bacterium]
MNKSSTLSTLVTVVVSLLFGAVVVALLGHSPAEAYRELFRGAFWGRFNFGGTLERFVPLLLTALAFAVSSKVAVFNVGVEGELYLGAIAAAWVGAALTGVAAPIHIGLCLMAAMAVGGAWAAIPGALKAYWRVNEVCVTILANYVAIYITSYLVGYPLSAGTGVPQTAALAATARLARILPPSRANSGLFIALAALLVTWWIVHRSTWGYKMRAVGENAGYAEHVGIRSRVTMVWGMVFSGALGGMAGAIEVMGLYGYFLDGFSPGIAFDGMLAALIARNDIRLVPLLAFFLAALKAGSLGMERFTGIPKSLVDAIIAMFILLAAMEGLFLFRRGARGKEA